MSYEQGEGYGNPGETWSRLGCLGWLFAAGAGFIAGVMGAAFANGALHWNGFWSFVVGIACFVGGASGVASLKRKMTTRNVYWCPQCGVETDPSYRICRSCGRVKE